MKYANNGKNRWNVLLSGVVLLALLTACGGHTHSASGGWNGDLKKHWQECECGEKTDTAAHTLEGDVCTVCGNEIFLFEEGGGQLTRYNENGDCLRAVSYGPDGSVEFAYEYQYSDDGSWMIEKEYTADVLTAQREYTFDAEGAQIMVKDIAYNEDGTFTAYGYDEYGNETLEGSYAANGDPESEVRYENEYDADGNRTLRRTYTDGVLTQEMEFLFGSDEDGSWSRSGKTTTYHEDGSRTVEDSDLDTTWATEITYDPAGNVVEELRYVYEYNDRGESVGAKGYRNGRLFEESRGIQGPDGGSIGIEIISYEEDGSKTVREYDEYLDLVKETTYDAAGNVVDR